MTLAKFKSECSPQRKQYIDVVPAGVDAIEGVEGGVLMLLIPPWRDPFGELEANMGEGMLYLSRIIKKKNRIKREQPE